MRGYIQLAVKLFEGDSKKAYIKTKLKGLSPVQYRIQSLQQSA